MSYDNIIATLPATGVSNAKNYSGEKSLYRAYLLVAIIDGKLDELGVVRIWYSNRASSNVAYCSVWTFGGQVKLWTSGHGKAGGYGYHRASQALKAALNSAGIKLDRDIGGVGDSAMHSALLAVCRQLAPGASDVHAMSVE